MSGNHNTNQKDLSLYELGLEYEKQIEIQNKFIADCNKKLRQAKKSGDYKAEMEIVARRRAFYGIREELSWVASILKNYYKE